MCELCYILPDLYKGYGWKWEDLCCKIKISMKTNADLQKDVQDAIKWEPLLSAAEIGVTAKDGIITLTGTVDSYRKKMEAEEAAKNVGGVKAVVEKIEIKFHSEWEKKDDNDIATEVLNAYQWNVEVPKDRVKVKVEEGWVTLEGELEWNFQKEAAKNAIRDLAVVAGVINNITIKANTKDEIERKDIESALERNWALNDCEIYVKVSGTKVTLTGTVHSLYQKAEAARIAWRAPGVSSLYNELVVDFAYQLAE
jgi:osmotically-inducible protein OsmY